MARTKDLHVEKRNRRLVADITQDPFQSYADLGRKHGMTEQMVYRILSDHNLISRERTKPRLKMADRKPISNFHVLVGSAIEAHFNEATLDRQDEGRIGKLAQWLSMSPKEWAASSREWTTCPSRNSSRYPNGSTCPSGTS